VDVDQQLLIESADGDSLPDIPLADVPLPDFALPNATFPNVALPNVALPNVALPNVALPQASLDCSLGEQLTRPSIAEEPMVVAFGLGSGSCLLHFICSNPVISGIDYHPRRKVFELLRVNLFMVFELVLFYWLYFIHSIMGHYVCRVLTTLGR